MKKQFQRLKGLVQTQDGPLQIKNIPIINFLMETYDFKNGWGKREICKDMRILKNYSCALEAYLHASELKRISNIKKLRLELIKLNWHQIYIIAKINGIKVTPNKLLTIAYICDKTYCFHLNQ